jgi:hypothetical protein
MAWDAEQYSIGAPEICWEDEPAFGSLVGARPDAPDYETRFEIQSLGITTNPATGFPMISGDMDGVDTGGNLFGSSSLSDSIGSIHSFDTTFSDPFSMH